MLSDLVTHEGSETSVQFQQKLAVSDIIKLLKNKKWRTLLPEVVTLAYLPYTCVFRLHHAQTSEATHHCADLK